MGLVVAYYRVSTRRQGESGLGLDAQRAAVLEHCRATGGELLAEFTEVESGTCRTRPKLAAACRLAKSRKATLVVAKLDRLARNVSFLSSLMDSKLDFVACDIPLANRMTIQILAAVAEHEAAMIGQRTRVALQAAKARGTLLGSHRPGHWDGHEQARKEGQAKGSRASAELRRAEAREAYVDIVPTLRELAESGYPLAKIADRLNESGITTREGGKWRPMSVSRVMRMHGLSPSKHIDSPLTPQG